MVKKTFKVIIMGGSAVGKNSLIKAACEIYGGKEPQGNAGKVTVTMDDTSYELTLQAFYDTGLTDSELQTLQKADGFIVVFDLSNRFSLERVNFYKKKIEKSSDIPALILIGNKSDIKDEREVETKDGLKLGDELKCSYFETSATSANFKGVEDSLKEIVRVIEQKKKSNKSGTDGKQCILQ